MPAKYADIIIDISHEAVDRVFQYEIPDSLRGKISVGMQAEIPFGKGNHLRTGYIIGFSDTAEIEEDKIKQIAGIREGTGASEQLIALADWMRTYYGTTMYQALRVVLPIRKKTNRQTEREIVLSVEEEKGKLRLAEYRRKHASAKARLLEALLQNPVIPQSLATNKLNVTTSTIDSLKKDGTVRVETKEESLRIGTGRRLAAPEPTLNVTQQQAVDTFCKDYVSGKRETYLLHGVTGSGKTEVYMHMIDAVIAEGKQAIMLIPEIGLTFQTLMRFCRHFGDRAAILHSRLSDGERYTQFERMKNGEVDICIGPRSALFAPFPKIGLIIMDEEHEDSYKSDQTPKYHAREVAFARAQMIGASVVLGSATPSITSYYEAKVGNYRLLTLPDRADPGAKLPTVEVVDLREELKRRNRSRLSISLRAAIEDRLAKKEQTILFMNRRGYANFVSCRSCGEAVICPHCQVTMTYHDHFTGQPRLVCHYCGYEEPFVKKCKKCGSNMIGVFGGGTEQLEGELKEYFPEARILRMDADTTKGKDGHEKILSAFADGEADILVGTQMVVKGHDYANVTLVGIIAADLSLHFQNYMAAEKTFQLLCQAAGRAGRGAKPGHVIIQTYEPEHDVIRLAAAQDYEAFYENEMAYRELSYYPPTQKMMVALLTSEDAAKVDRAAKDLAERVRGDATFTKGRVRILGPSPAVIPKIKDQYRRVIYLKAPEEEILARARDAMEAALASGSYEDVYVAFDRNPVRSY